MQDENEDPSSLRILCVLSAPCVSSPGCTQIDLVRLLTFDYSLQDLQYLQQAVYNTCNRQLLGFKR